MPHCAAVKIAELEALKLGLNLAGKVGGSALVIETDCLTTFQMIKGYKSPDSLVSGLVNDCYIILETQSQLEVAFYFSGGKHCCR